MSQEQRTCIEALGRVDSACIALRGNSRRERLFQADELRTLREGPDSYGAGLPFCPACGPGAGDNPLPSDRFSDFVKKMKVFPIILVCVVLVGCGNRDEGTAASSGAANAGTAIARAPGLPPPGTVTPLEPRMKFPPVPVKGLDGQATDAAALVQGRDSIVLFISLGCESCEDLTALWTRLQGELPQGLNVIGVANEEPDFAKKYLAEHPFPFPLYCDTGAVFEESFKIRAYPSVVGVLDNGSVAYVGKAVTTEFTPKKAVDLLMKVKQGREGK